MAESKTLVCQSCIDRVDIVDFLCVGGGGFLGFFFCFLFLVFWGVFWGEEGWGLRWGFHYLVFHYDVSSQLVENAYMTHKIT